MTPAYRPRIVLLSPSLAAMSGVSTHVNMLLGSNLRKDFDLLHFQVGSEGRREGTLGKAWRWCASPFALAVALVRRRVDIVHINTSLNQKAYWRDLVYLYVVRLFGRKVVTQVHGGALPQGFFPRNNFLTWLLRQAMVGSHAVAVLSSEEFKAYRAFDARIKVHLVPNAVVPGGLIGRSRQHNTRAPLRLVYVGRLIASKGLFETVEALGLLKSQGRSYTFKIAGGGLDEIRLREAVVTAGLEERVTFLGPVCGANKDALWLESDVFIFPTWHKEGLPYAILEAMSAGCVPITCPVGGIPDVIENGVHGLLVPSRDAEALAGALTGLDDDRAAMVRMAAASGDRVKEHYTTKRLADDFRRLYTSL